VPASASFAAIALLLASAAAATLGVVNRLARFDPAGPQTARRAAAPRARIRSIESDGSRVSLSGSAPDGFGVLLFSGGRFVSVEQVSAGNFRFDRVEAAGPFRVGLIPLSDELPATAARPGKEIVVSFDAGSSDRGAEEILRALRERKIHTTIFLTGQFIEHYPDIAREIARDGHEVGNHTWDHPHLTTYATNGEQDTRPGVTEAFLRSELDRTRALFEKITGARMAPLWRAPYGEENARIRDWARSDGYSHVSWTHGHGANLDSLDWVSDPASPRYRTSERVVERLVSLARPGGIMLLHLGTDRKEDAVAPRVPELLDSLASRGYRFARASEILSTEAAER